MNDQRQAGVTNILDERRLKGTKIKATGGLKFDQCGDLVKQIIWVRAKDQGAPIKGIGPLYAIHFIQISS